MSSSGDAPRTSIPLRRVLLIDNDPAERARAEQALFTGGHGRSDQAGFVVEDAATLRAGFERLSEGNIDAVVLELALPDSTGLATLRRLRVAFPAVPVVVLTALDDAEAALEAVQAGAQDYLVKSLIHPTVLVRVVLYACERNRVQLAQLGFIDQLTQLFTLSGFVAVAEQIGRLAKRNERGMVLLVAHAEALASLGPENGEEEERVILKAAEILRGTFRASDVIGRTHRDRFAILAVEAPQETIPRIIERLAERVGKENAGADGPGALRVGATAVTPEMGNKVEAWIARAEAAVQREDRRRH